MQGLGRVVHAGPNRSLNVVSGETGASGFRKPTLLRLRSHCDRYEAHLGSHQIPYRPRMLRK